MKIIIESKIQLLKFFEPAPSAGKGAFFIAGELVVLIPQLYDLSASIVMSDWFVDCVGMKREIPVNLLTCLPVPVVSVSRVCPPTHPSSLCFAFRFLFL